MLVLTRKNRDTIRIGDNVTVTILRVKGNTVRIGIEAPREVRVLRGELPDDFGEGSLGEVDQQPSLEHEQEEPLPRGRSLPLWRHQAQLKSHQEAESLDSVLTPEMMAQYCA